MIFSEERGVGGVERGLQYYRVQGAKKKRTHVHPILVKFKCNITAR